MRTTYNCMQVLIITETLRSDSGTGRYSSLILREYPELGVVPTVLTAGTSNATGKKEAELLPLTSWWSFLKNVLLARKRARSFPIVHGFDVWPYGVDAYLSVLGTTKALFLNGVGTYSVAPKYFSLKRILMRRALMRAKKVYCISEYTARRVRESAAVRTEVVLLGATKMPPISKEYLEDVKKKHVLQNRSPICITVGQIKHRKGQLDTLRALSRLKEIFPNLSYVIVGNDDDEQYVGEIKNFAAKHGMSEQVKILPNVSDEELSALYMLSDVFCLTSNNDQDHFEGFGLVFLEAAQFGVPGVGSRSCGIESALKDGYSGYLAHQGDERDIAQAIQAVLREKNRLGEQARHFAASFSWRKAAEHFVKGYEEIRE